MASVNFPKSFDMSSKGAPAPAQPQIVRIRSDNSTYTCNSSGATDTIRIELPTGGRGQYLFPNDSFITGKFTPTISGATAGAVLVDGCVYSFFRRIRILQGSSVLADSNNCGRLWNALRDIQVTSGSRSRDEIALVTESTASTQLSVSAGFSGKTLATTATYDFSFVLPAPLLGSFTKSAVPLCLMGASSIFLELELNPSNIATTTRVFANADGAIGACSADPVSSVVFSEIYYSAKMCMLDDMYQQALMSVYAGGILLPSIDYVSDQKTISSGSTNINEKLAFNKSSCNAILWWMTPATIANGTVTAFNLADGVSTRIAGALKDYTIQVSGNNLIDVKAGTSRTGLFFGSQPLLQLHRVYNQSVVDGCGILNETNYCGSLDTYAECVASAKRFVGAYSLERYDADSSYQSGMNLVGQDVRLVVNFESGTTIAHNLYTFAMVDVAYEIRDGVVSVRS